MTDLDRITTLGRALYGERWQRAVAADIGCDEKLVRMWMTGTSYPRPEHVRTLQRAAIRRFEAIGEALNACFAGSE